MKRIALTVGKADTPPLHGKGLASPAGNLAHERKVADLLPDSFALARSESEWLLTLLSADELRYIFEGPDHVEGKG